MIVRRIATTAAAAAAYSAALEGGAVRVAAARTAPLVPSRRALSSSAVTLGIFDGLGNTFRRIALGGRQERENQQKRSGLLPEEAKRLEDDSKRASAYAATAADGSALLEEPEALEVFTTAEAENTRQRERQVRRQARKRWNARDATTGAALEHKYSTAQFKISPRKLNMLAHQIAQKPIDHAILQMEFSHKRAARRVKSTLALARDHAIAKGMDPARLVVSEAWVGKGMYIARPDFKGRARMGIKHHPSARMSVVLRNGQTHDEKEKLTLLRSERRLRSMGTAGVARTERPIINVHQRPGWAW
ncbi:unnamed protein product [Tilletia controversa]|uniref:50S ribosomal protein L22 n=3 Tax=Tilletia TaxID=13289 RepID=A0A8X7MPV0_9BASI|nr:hypothetical protein CF336_g2335 [Tilletia laevis]KAE8198040.1 hypothetical protein CF328_g3665 [Tilletia controversa]KAE8263106.1 hypothetical protein A4X03_0g1933 [Tilletia caries]KAE8206690.1 hypothetical protein CF335_g1684 [Tilletia laevis]KAE8244085.1 hypothetical protein A4X06_0g5982 [Tilletia controversa]